MACLGLSGLAWRVRRSNRERFLTGWRRRFAAVAEIALALGGVIAHWPLNDHLSVVGIPFPIFFLERNSTGVGGKDFLGATSLPFLCLDVWIGGALGYGLVAWMTRERAKVAAGQQPDAADGAGTMESGS